MIPHATLKRFASEMLVFEAGARVRATPLLDAYTAWAKRSGMPVVTATAFGRDLKSAGFERKASNFMFYLNVRLRVAGDAPGIGDASVAPPLIGGHAACGRVAKASPDDEVYRLERRVQHLSAQLVKALAVLAMARGTCAQFEQEA